MIRILHMALLSTVCVWASQTALAQSYKFVHWDSATPCTGLLKEAIPVLPGGSTLRQIYDGPTIQSHYDLRNGGKLRMSIRDVGTKYVDGDTFLDAYSKVFDKRPLEDSISRRVNSHVTLADINYRPGFNLRFKKHNDPESYEVRLSSLVLTLNSKIRVIAWRQYDTASTEDQLKWDKFACQSYHHELGHLLVAAQVYEDTQDRWSELSASTHEDINAQTDRLFSEIVEAIKDRQAKYHDEIDEMGPALASSRPYLDLPFTWLGQTQIDSLPLNE